MITREQTQPITPTLSYTPKGKISLARANAGGPVINRFPAGDGREGDGVPMRPAWFTAAGTQ